MLEKYIRRSLRGYWAIKRGLLLDRRQEMKRRWPSLSHQEVHQYLLEYWKRLSGDDERLLEELRSGALRDLGTYADALRKRRGGG